MTKRSKILLAAGILAIVLVSAASFTIFSVLQSNKAKTPEFKGFIEAVLVAEVPFEQMVSDSERLVRIRIDKIIPSTDERLIYTTISESYLKNLTLYEATIIYDYSATSNDEESIFFTQYGTHEWQMEGDPVFSVGDEFIVFIVKSSEADNYYCALGGPNAIYDVKDSADGEYLYKRFNEHPVKSYEMIASEKSVLTSTRENPVEYVQKTRIEDLLEAYNNMRDSK